MPLNRLARTALVTKPEKPKAQIIKLPVTFMDIVFTGGVAKSYVIEAETTVATYPDSYVFTYANGDTVTLNRQHVLIVERHEGFVERKGPEPDAFLKDAPPVVTPVDPK